MFRSIRNTPIVTFMTCCLTCWIVAFANQKQEPKPYSSVGQIPQRAYFRPIWFPEFADPQREGETDKQYQTRLKAEELKWYTLVGWYEIKAWYADRVYIPTPGFRIPKLQVVTEGVDVTNFFTPEELSAGWEYSYSPYPNCTVYPCLLNAEPVL